MPLQEASVAEIPQRATDNRSENHSKSTGPATSAPQAMTPQVIDLTPYGEISHPATCRTVRSRRCRFRT